MASVLQTASSDAIRRIQRVQIVTIAWMSVEAMVSLFAAWRARSPALLAFGGDSAIELLSAVVVLWRFRASDAREDVEKRAARVAGALLFTLAAFVAVTSGTSLLGYNEPKPTLLGIAILVAAAAVMPWLAKEKRRLSGATGSAALKADAAQSALCAYLSLILGGTGDQRADGHVASSEDCFVEVGDFVEIPDQSALRQTTNTKGLGALLSAWSGIEENLHEPPPGQTRPSLTANVRQALALCFQPQDEIIRRQQLFHGAGDNFVAQALKDTLPYFLGAVDDDYVRKREQLRRVREQLRSCERKLAEIAALRGEALAKPRACSRKRETQAHRG